MPAVPVPAPGKVVFVGPHASDQFALIVGFNYQVIGVHDWPAPHAWAWAWLDGYQLTTGGGVEDRRSVLVRLAGLLPPATFNDG